MIVEHYTVDPQLPAGLQHVRPDTPDPELHELPGVCSHFVIDTDGTIYQLVPLAIMCRHTVGLNYTAIGIEHVGMTRRVSGNRRQMAASLRLTRLLQGRYGISTRNVIGHNENLSSPYHRERVPRLRRRRTRTSALGDEALPPRARPPARPGERALGRRVLAGGAVRARIALEP